MAAIPILWMPVWTVTSDDRERLQAALAEISHVDAGVLVRVDAGADQVLYSGTSLDHLAETAQKLETGYEVTAWALEPQVRYLEAIRTASDGEGKYIRQTGGSGNYGHVKVRLEPGERGSGLLFRNAIVAEVIPERFIASVEGGVREGARGGVLAGFELTDCAAVLFDGSWHETDSNEMAFQIAATMAVQEAGRRASPVVMEPVMTVAFTVAEGRAGMMIDEISARRGRVEDVEGTRGTAVIRAMIPLKEMLSWDCGPRTMVFSRYEPVPVPDQRGTGGVPATRPRGPEPKPDAAAADPEGDWT
jgi:elongation factor G